MVDEYLVGKKLSIIDEYLKYIEANRSRITEKTLRDDFGLMISISHALQTLAQGSVDICTHLASDEGWELPDNAAHALRIAQRHHVISDEVANELTLAIKLRNIIVHQYENLDLKIIEDVVHHKIGIFSRFTTETKQWLEKRKSLKKK